MTGMPMVPSVMESYAGMSTSTPMSVAICETLSAPTAWITCTKPVLDESANAFARVMVP